MSEQRMRIAIDVSAVPARPAGAGRYVVELAAALSARDDVALQVVSRRDDLLRWQLDGRTAVRAIAPAHLVARLAFGEVLLGAALRRGPSFDVLHGPHYSLPMGHETPAVVTIHDLTLLEHPEWHERSKVVFFQRALRLANRRADVIVVPSRIVADAYGRHFGDDVEVCVIPHGVDHLRFVVDEPSPGADNEALRRHGIDWPYVFNLATLEPRKNLPLLVEAFARIASTERELRLVLAGGSGWKQDPLDAAIASSGVADRIRRLGYVADDDVPALLRGARVVAYPSIEEGFGLPALEALACGAPLVTTKGSAMEEVSGDSALLVDPSDSDSLAEAIAEVLAGGVEVARRRSLGVSRAAGYTWEASAAAHLAAYGLARSSHGARTARRSA